MLDTAFAHPSVFRKLSEKANLKHVRHDFNLSRTAEDEEIYNLASKENRFVITQDAGFKKQVKQNKVAVFIIPSYLTNQEIDLLIFNFIKGKNPDDFIGKAVKI